MFVLAVAQSGFASLTWWMRASGSGPGVDAHPLGQVRTASGQVLTPFPPPDPPSVLYAIVKTAQIQHAAATVTQAQIQHAAATVAQAQIQDAPATMPNFATKIAVSSRWEDCCNSGQDHVTVSSRARIEVATRHGTIRSLRRQCPPLATGCGASRWQTRQMGRGHPMRGRRMARPGGASEFCIIFWYRRRQARHVRRSRRCRRGERST